MSTATKESTKLLTWYGLIEKLKSCNEAEALAMLQAEAKTGNRDLWKQRIYQRYSKLRREREHKAFLGRA